MTLHDHKTIVRRILEAAFNQGDLDALDAGFTPDATIHDPGQDFCGPAQLRKGLKGLLTASRTSTSLFSTSSPRPTAWCSATVARGPIGARSLAFRPPADSSTTRACCWCASTASASPSSGHSPTSSAS
ncbi:MAG: nuclear transport factor 2 family protein [Chloroflexi bacterium]|nr:nuclear transport factor 2 family protein [Chloroflexota bacterium]